MTVNNADWDLELSTLTELINERSKVRPAIVFDKIKGYPEGYRVAVNLFSSLQRLALTMGMDPKIGEFDFVQQWRKPGKNSPTHRAAQGQKRAAIRERAKGRRHRSVKVSRAALA